jgi:hypothetical protein
LGKLYATTRSQFADDAPHIGSACTTGAAGSLAWRHRGLGLDMSPLTAPLAGALPSFTLTETLASGACIAD